MANVPELAEIVVPETEWILGEAVQKVSHVIDAISGAFSQESDSLS